jgi:hypothetical protein
VSVPSPESVEVTERGRTLEFTFEDLLRYHGPGSPAGVACAFKAMQRAFGMLSRSGPPPRRSIVVRTPFRGPGARDGFEAVTRAVTDGRYVVDRTLVRSDRGILLEDFVFEISLASADVDPVMLLLCEGFVTEEFIGLARTDRRTDAQEERLDELKAVMADVLTATPAAEVFELGQVPGAR